MDNENKVGHLPQVRATAAFLRGDIEDSQREVVEYSLDTEFKKARKNRNYFVYVMVLVFMLVLGLAVMVTGNLLQMQSRNVSISIADFDDLKLAEILSDAKKAYDNINELNQQIEYIKLEWQNALIELKQKTEMAKGLLIEREMTEEQVAREEKRLDSDEARKSADLASDYQAKIQDIQIKIDELQQKVGMMDKNLLAAARKSEDVFGGYQKLFDIRMNQGRDFFQKQLRDQSDRFKKEKEIVQKFYDDKIELLNQKHDKELMAMLMLYNPSFTEKAEIDALKYGSSDPVLNLNAYRKLLGDKKIISENEFKDLRNKIATYNLLLSRIQKVPYTNSISPAIRSMSALTKTIIQTYEDIWVKMGETLERQASLINNYDYAMSYYIQQGRTAGYVLDARDPKQIMVYMGRIYSVKSGDTAIIFRNDDEYIGKIRLTTMGDRVVGEVIEKADDETVQPLDKILIKID